MKKKTSSPVSFGDEARPNVKIYSSTCFSSPSQQSFAGLVERNSSVPGVRFARDPIKRRPNFWCSPVHLSNAPPLSKKEKG